MYSTAPDIASELRPGAPLPSRPTGPDSSSPWSIVPGVPAVPGAVRHPVPRAAARIPIPSALR